MSRTWEVIVGNIGTVYSGPSGAIARQKYGDYQDMSQDNYGRASGESVVLMCNGEPVKEYAGTVEA